MITTIVILPKTIGRMLILILILMMMMDANDGGMDANQQGDYRVLVDQYRAGDCLILEQHRL
jgi:hypothetical protein